MVRVMGCLSIYFNISTLVVHTRVVDRFVTGWCTTSLSKVKAFLRITAGKTVTYLSFH
jgi:hypothetical protein